MTLKLVPQVSYKDLYEGAKNESCIPGSNLGSKVRNGAEILNATAKAGVAAVAVYSVMGAGHIAGFVKGFWRGTARPGA